jgi:Tfp pilus assembly protein PilF
MYDDALQQFQAIVKNSGEVPSALTNIGNILYLGGKAAQSIGYFNRALAQSPDQSTALQGLVKAGYELAQPEVVNSALAKLKTADPDAFALMSTLGTASGDTARAASADKEVNTWNDE